MMSERANSCEVAVVGAGPYGLSVAAHLAQAGVSTAVFGDPMAFWREQMPNGMVLRSPWRASHISDPQSSLSLDAYAAAHGLDGKTLPVEQFVAYGEWFQRHAVPDVDRRSVQSIAPAGGGFRLTLADGEVVTASRVVVATGLRNQEFRPPLFRDAPAALVTHTSQHRDLAVFRGKRVAVVGRGQSATESAALLAESGADVEIISRGEIYWLGQPASAQARPDIRSWIRKILAAPSEVGPFPLSWLVEVPGVVRHLPDSVRDEFARRCLRPAAAGWLKPRFNAVACNPGRTIAAARERASRVVLDLDTGAREFDHVLLGTGYRVDISRLGFLSPQLLQKIDCVLGSPSLGAGFESSVPKLHFVGSYAVNSFGPLLRFIAGAPYAARSVTQAVSRGAALSAAAALPRQPARIIGPAAPDMTPPR
jgi:cation diffusion facilitator CzcD-associated flavoprotein CzcO